MDVHKTIKDAMDSYYDDHCKSHLDKILEDEVGFLRAFLEKLIAKLPATNGGLHRALKRTVRLTHRHLMIARRSENVE